jgi:two-component sensor histidine kinase
VTKGSDIILAVADSSTIVITMPASLQFRDVAIRTLSAASHLIGADENVGSATDGTQIDLRRGFDAEFISAFSEIFNNISIHAYERKGQGEVKIEISPGDNHLLVTIEDSGKSFDIDSVTPPELESLPEGGMGIHIARSCLDELAYTPGPPNLWRLTKYLTKDGIE